MKKSILLFLLILVTHILYSQWEWQNPKPTGNPLYDIYFTDNDHGWIVGANGTVLKTNSNGNNWEVCPTESNKDLQEVVFLNDNEGLIVCDDGCLLKTLNDGESWDYISTEFDHIYGLEYQSSNMWLLADSNKILHSSDFGLSWNVVYDNPNIHLSAISFADDNFGWATGYDHSSIQYSGIILKTTDGGINWQVDTLGYNWGIDIIFFDELTGYLTTYWEGVYKTENGGDTWNLSHGGGSVSTEMFFLDEDHGWLHCVTENTWPQFSEYRTTDGGQTWMELPTYWGISNTYLAARFYTSSEKGFLLNGFYTQNYTIKLYRTDDGGYNWIDLNLLESITGLEYERFTAIEVNNEQVGYAISDYNSMARLYKTLDDGNNWEHKINMPIRDPSAIHFIDEDHGWVVGWSSYPNDAAKVYSVNDGGNNFQDLSPNVTNRINSVFFINDSKGFIVGSSGLIMITEDGGESWNQINSNTVVELFDIMLIDDIYGWICGDDGNVLYSDDGGITWESQSGNTLNSLYSIDFIDIQNGCAAGEYGTIIYTHNGGETWYAGNSDSNLVLNDIKMESIQTGIAVGKTIYGNSKGILLSTHDGGETWQKPYQPCHNKLSSISIPEPGQVWIAGYGSSILHYTCPLSVSIDQSKTISSELNFYLYPNPVKNIARLCFEKEFACSANVRIFNVSGICTINQGLLLKQSGQQEFEINLSVLPAGIYFLQLQIDNKVETRKIIKVQ